ncbi:PilZ domain-containing protein [Sphingomonas sp. KRR8]|uniref:PilZ domain-containing protein n=1 Tax=Sphingomonas sp. KRR8 TaxID=2942996 RepID=UPI002020C9A9|nr:PilZ domain-containing protein [Sphingomonas sp. KRR8]URD61236.1 PilZ domain-containing protein [Sphingomonas sp. KRR8]
MTHDSLWQRELWATDGPGRPMRWRQGIRCKLKAQVLLRRSNRDKFQVDVDNFSRHGCCLTFVDEPILDERVSIKFEGLELLGAAVCWIRHRQVGLEFEKPLHEAVFGHLVQKLDARCPDRG